MATTKVGFVGAGSMGEALIRGILRGKLIPPQNLWICDKVEEKLLSLLPLKVRISSQIRTMIKKVDVLFIAVKPQDMDAVLKELKNETGSFPLIISIAAGVSTSYISRELGGKVPVLRVMPNIASLVGEGISAISRGEETGEEHMKMAKEILGSVGEVIEVSEDKQDAITGLSGSGPAYIYMVMQGLIEGGVRAGLEERIASKLAIQTTLGAAKLAKNNKISLRELKTSVISPGGTTAKGLKVLDEGGLRDCLARAVIQASRRARELRR
jgi:pyrroline-5-carboxylate reductase